MQGGVYPNMPFNQQMTFPREFTLRTTPAGPRLFREPIKEIASLHGAETDWSNLVLADNSGSNLVPSGQTFHIQAELSIPAGMTVIFHIRGADLTLTNATMECGNKVGVAGELTYIEILVDRTSIEVFANHGEATLSRCFLPTREGISLECHGGTATLKSIKVFDVKSAWPADVK